MTETIMLFEKGLQCCEVLLKKYPQNTTLQSVKKQIAYLLELEEGISLDRSKLMDITIGVLTAREIESMDDDAAEIFHKISSAAKNM